MLLLLTYQWSLDVILSGTEHSIGYCFYLIVKSTTMSPEQDSRCAECIWWEENGDGTQRECDCTDKKVSSFIYKHYLSFFALNL